MSEIVQFFAALLLLSCFTTDFLVGGASSRGSTHCKNLAAIDNVSSNRHWRYDNVTVFYGNSRDYQMYRRIGKGGFGEVYLGRQLSTGMDCIIKLFLPGLTAEWKMNKEIMISQTLCGAPHIVKLLDVVRDDVTRQPAMIIEYVNNTYHKELYGHLTPEDVKLYSYQLLLALQFTHDMGIIHKDIKPANLVIDNEKKMLKLIDWGLAVIYHKEDNQTVAGTANYKAPEMIVGYEKFDMKIDMWSFGCIFAEWILRRRSPMFAAHHKTRQALLVEIMRIRGSAGMVGFVKRTDLDVDVNRLAKNKTYPRQSLKSFRNEFNAEYATDAALDLLDHLLEIDPLHRYSASTAMKHAFFQ